MERNASPPAISNTLIVRVTRGHGARGRGSLRSERSVEMCMVSRSRERDLDQQYGREMPPD